VDELSAIPQASREIALQRFELLRPHLEEARPLRTVASEGSIPYRTALCWASGYREDGLAALARRGRSDQGGRRLASTMLIKAIEGLALEGVASENGPYRTLSQVLQLPSTEAVGRRR
jgi:putative transposase